MLKRIFLFLLILSILILPVPAFACDSCQCALSRMSDETIEAGKKWFFDFTTEERNWNEKTAEEAHAIHHTGHDVHNKTHEEFFHFSVGFKPFKDLTILADLPQVKRASTDVEHHSTLGKKEFSEGLGDLSLSAAYKLFKDADGFIGPLASVKFPTGATQERNSRRELFEVELQPGSGSYDASLGATFGRRWGAWSFSGNLLYTWKTQGSRDFQFGNLFSSYTTLAYALNPESHSWRTKLGVDFSFQSEDEETSAGITVLDSGGQTLLLGPSISTQINDNAVLAFNFLLPVYEDLGGVHQKLDFVWNATAKIIW